MIGILEAMGFDRESARTAASSSASVQDAVELLMAPSVEEATVNLLDNALSWVNRAFGTEEDSLNAQALELLDKLVAMGFSEKHAREAVRRCSSIEAAMDWLEGHPEAD